MPMHAKEMPGAKRTISKNKDGAPKGNERAAPDNTDEKVDTRFKAGAEWKGNPNGRPKGSRNKVSEAFLRELYELWEKQGANLINKVALKDPATIIRVTAQLVPKEFQVSTDKEDPFLTFLEMMEERDKAEKAMKLREPPAE
jgi:hypothetical protein